jgi:hypothetical protein
MSLESNKTLMDANGMIGHYGNSQGTNKHDDNSQMSFKTNELLFNANGMMLNRK